MPSGKRMTKQRKLQVWLMVGALLLMFVGLPIGLYFANGFNGYLSSSNEWTQIENTTKFKDAPILDEDDEHRYASYNGTTVTEETPTWDSSEEWDSLTVAGTGTNQKVVLNWNTTIDDLLSSKISQFRIKLNCSEHLKVTINLVKWDGVTLTSKEAYSNGHIKNASQTIYWNITPIGLLTLKTGLNADATDTVYFQIIIEGYDSDNYLTAGDSFQFQLATGEASNVYSFSSIQILRGSVTILGLVLLMFGFASTPYWNPFGEGKRRR